MNAVKIRAGNEPPVTVRIPPVPLSEIGLPDEFLEHASRDQILDRVGLNAQDISREIVAQVLGARVPHARAIPEDAVVSDQARLAE